MPASRHNYAPIYSKYFSSVFKDGLPATPVIAEVGILTGSGLAMWSHLFPGSRIFGFDLNVTSYRKNKKHLKSLGFKPKHVRVTQMDQMVENGMLLAKKFGSLRPSIVVDDGYHIPEAGKRTFLSMEPFLEDSFVYFIEDVVKKDIVDGRWAPVKDEVLKKCINCAFDFECPETSDKNECVVVVSRT